MPAPGRAPEKCRIGFMLRRDASGRGEWAHFRAHGDAKVMRVSIGKCGRRLVEDAPFRLS
jgi:hypothetical protein